MPYPPPGCLAGCGGCQHGLNDSIRTSVIPMWAERMQCGAPERRTKNTKYAVRLGQSVICSPNRFNAAAGRKEGRKEGRSNSLNDTCYELRAHELTITVICQNKRLHYLLFIIINYTRVGEVTLLQYHTISTLKTTHVRTCVPRDVPHTDNGGNMIRCSAS